MAVPIASALVYTFSSPLTNPGDPSAAAAPTRAPHFASPGYGAGHGVTGNTLACAWLLLG